MKYLKKSLLALALLAAFLFGACSVGTVEAGQNHPLKIWKQNDNGYAHTWNIVDESTGVNYIVVTTHYAANSGEYSIAITPRLNADGSLYVTK